MQIRDWNPTDPQSWSRALGLIHVPLFPDSLAKKEPGKHAVLMDGQATSFALSICNDSRELEDRPLSWSWSSDVNHAVIVDSGREEFFVRRWDLPLARRFRLPSKVSQTREIVDILRQSGALRAPDVVSHVLRAFRQVRAAMQGQETIEAVKVFLALLVAAEQRKLGVLSASDVANASNVGDIVRMINDSESAIKEIINIEQRTKQITIGTLLLEFLQPQPLTGCILEPTLLLRHAAGRLFQEANLIVEREPMEQLHFAGLAPDRRPSGKLERDVRFTPSTLARTLVERCLNALQPQPKKIRAFDPACGSGIFLVEVLRELQSRDFSGEVSVAGFDVSDISCLLAKFCLNRAVFESKISGFRVKVDIRCQDALANDWPDFDVALMNPPFVPWDRMAAPMREKIREVLGELAFSRCDKAMAFVWKAVKQIKQGKVIGAVIPAPLLETQSGEPWRNAIAERSEFLLIGKFHGFGYFVASQVEPAFFVLAHRGTQISPNTKVVMAKAGSEDECLRALRLGVETTSTGAEGWEIYSALQQSLSPANWMPRSQADLDLLDGLRTGVLSRVGDIFNVRQGIRAGHACFVISQEEFETLRSREREYFRPAATNETIREGRIFREAWIFYPYDKDGVTIRDETELRAKVPTYFEKSLKPLKGALQRRLRTNPDTWWLLAQERGWQHEWMPKLVSTYFGSRGRFACDKTGEFSVVQGQGWLWRKSPGDSAVEKEAPNRWFFTTELPFAYLAIFNSSVFERLLALFCPRVQGGQFDLSNRFVDKVPVPDLSNVESCDADACTLLVEIGRRIHAGRPVELAQLENLVSRIYRMPVG